MLLFVEGFDYLATADISKRWTCGSGTVGATGRSGSNGIGSVNGLMIGLPATGSTIIIGFAVKPSLTSGDLMFVCYDLASIVSDGMQVMLRTKADGAIEVVRGSAFTVIGTSAPGVVTAGTHYYIEMKVLFSDTVGTVDVHVNGTSVISVSAIDTKGSTLSDLWNIVAFDDAGAVGLDDIYICDGSGSFNNDFLGNVHVEALFAVADSVAAGTYAQCTPSTGSDHGAMEDETAPNTADYNAATAAGQRDSYRLTAPSTGVAIFGIEALVLVEKTDTEHVTFDPFVLVGGTQFTGERCYPSAGDYDYFSQIEERNPATSGAWTADALTTLEIGIARS